MTREIQLLKFYICFRIYNFGDLKYSNFKSCKAYLNSEQGLVTHGEKLQTNLAKLMKAQDKNNSNKVQALILKSKVQLEKIEIIFKKIAECHRLKEESEKIISQEIEIESEGNDENLEMTAEDSPFRSPSELTEEEVQLNKSVLLGNQEDEAEEVPEQVSEDSIQNNDDSDDQTNSEAEEEASSAPVKEEESPIEENTEEQEQEIEEEQEDEPSRNNETQSALESLSKQLSQVPGISSQLLDQFTNLMNKSREENKDQASENGVQSGKGGKGGKASSLFGKTVQGKSGSRGQNIVVVNGELIESEIKEEPVEIEPETNENETQPESSNTGEEIETENQNETEEIPESIMDEEMVESLDEMPNSDSSDNDLSLSLEDMKNLIQEEEEDPELVNPMAVFGNAFMNQMNEGSVKGADGKAGESIQISNSMDNEVISENETEKEAEIEAEEETEKESEEETAVEEETEEESVKDFEEEKTEAEKAEEEIAFEEETEVEKLEPQKEPESVDQDDAEPSAEEDSEIIQELDNIETNNEDLDEEIEDDSELPAEVIAETEEQNIPDQLLGSPQMSEVFINLKNVGKMVVPGDNQEVADIADSIIAKSSNEVKDTQKIQDKLLNKIKTNEDEESQEDSTEAPSARVKSADQNNSDTATNFVNSPGFQFKFDPNLLKQVREFSRTIPMISHRTVRKSKTTTHKSEETSTEVSVSPHFASQMTNSSGSSPGFSFDPINLFLNQNQKKVSIKRPGISAEINVENMDSKDSSQSSTSPASSSSESQNISYSPESLNIDPKTCRQEGSNRVCLLKGTNCILSKMNGLRASKLNGIIGCATLAKSISDFESKLSNMFTQMQITMTRG